MSRYFYSDTIPRFVQSSIEQITGELVLNSRFGADAPQIEAWKRQIEILQPLLCTTTGRVFFEYSIPRMGRRVDVILVIRNVVFVIEFKVGEREFHSYAVDQVCDYALDLKNFHETSREPVLAPVLVCTEAPAPAIKSPAFSSDDRLLNPIMSSAATLKEVIQDVLQFAAAGRIIDSDLWETGRYAPTPTIIEAATKLYNDHSVAEISRSDASAKNLSDTSTTISKVIERAKANNEKLICFVTGVPGAGKTLVGLDIATKHLDSKTGATSVFLSGNGPLVNILREALTRDKVQRAKEAGGRIKKGEVMSKVKVFIQNVHHYRDEYLKDERPPVDHVAIFDEAQRAWNLHETASFMKRKKGRPDFDQSEPEFLISCLDRHPDWAVIVCLVGGGQEINRGEAGISEWIDALNRSFPDWKIYVSDRLTDAEYDAGRAIEHITKKENINVNNNLHLAVSMRSFRAERVSALVKDILDIEIEQARENLRAVIERYPIVLTRDLNTAKQWLRSKARGSERYGIIASSSAERLKANGVHVKTPIDPVNWFLNGKQDVRSSYFLEDAATEFHVQGLELDWACVVWDADFRFTGTTWTHHSFVGDRWQNVKKEERKQYLKNAYRVLLTRARQGMVIVVPSGNESDDTRKSAFYDFTFNYLKTLGLSILLG
jgi:Uncharacterized conserved protein (DUF2075)